MNRLIRWYNKNRKIIWTAVAIIACILFLTRILNFYYENNEKKEKTIPSIYNNPDYSVISEKEIKEDKAKSNINIIDNFIDCCNDRNIEGAYNLLTSNCKKKFFPGIEDFKEYIEKVFSKKMTGTYQAWITESKRYTYRIELSEDLLSTGNSSSKKMESYYTIVKENGQDKLNIKNYVDTERINKSVTKYGVTITAVKRDIFIEYEVYTFNIENKSQKEIKLDSGDYLAKMYLQDSRDASKTCERYELSEEELLVSGKKDNLQIKYLAGYNPDITIEKIVFDDVILNYQEYLQEGSTYSQRESFEIVL